MPSTEEIISPACFSHVQTGNSIQVQTQHPNAKTLLFHIPPTHSRNKPFLHSKDCVGSCGDCHYVASQIPILCATLHLQKPHTNLHSYSFSGHLLATLSALLNNFPIIRLQPVQFTNVTPPSITIISPQLQTTLTQGGQFRLLSSFQLPPLF